MKKFSSMWAVVCVAILTSSLSAQDEVDQQSLRDKIAGTWTINLERSKEILDDDVFEQIKSNADGIKMIFKEDGTLDLVRGGSAQTAEYSLSTVEASDDQYRCELNLGGRVMKADITFLEADLMKLAPEGNEPPAILQRAASGFTLNEARQMLIGDWSTDEEATRKLMDDKEAKVPKLEMSFGKDGVLGAGQNGDSKEGSYSLDSMTSEEDEDSGAQDKAIQFDLMTSVGDDERTFGLEIMDKDHVVLKPGDKTSVVLKRANQ